jgi:hypothetical protein
MRDVIKVIRRGLGRLRAESRLLRALFILVGALLVAVLMLPLLT